MARVRVSTTVDGELLAHARHALGLADAALFDAALEAVVARQRAGEIDAAYAAAYEAHPIDEPDEWGDLSLFRDVAAAS